MKVDLWPLFWIVLILMNPLARYLDHLAGADVCPKIEATQKEKP